jgi:hypothetical protein
MEQTPQSQLKLLVAKGKEQGYLTYAEVNDHLPQDIVDSDQIEDIIQMINDMGIQAVENAPMPMTLSWLKVVPPMRTLPKQRPRHWHLLNPRLVVRPIPSACTCGKWVPSNC